MFKVGEFFLTVLFVLHGSSIMGQSYRATLNAQLPNTINFINRFGNPTAYYEIYLTNFSTDTFKLKRLFIVNSSDSFIHFTMQNQELKNSYNKIGSITKDTTLRLLPGNSAVIYVELSLQKEQIKEVTHRISFEIAGKENLGEVSIETSATKCSLDTPLVLGAPLKDGCWAAIYEPSWEKGHRRAIYTMNGKARIPGRYAIDFIKLDSNGKYANADENVVKNWFGYEVDVVAVTDGIVSSTRDDFSESPTLSEHPKYTADKATGNYLSIKIGNNQFAFYEHLKPKSIKVKIGQSVKKGDVIASLGFTGQTTGPHLHFHVADADSPLGAEGIPFVFEQFEMLGSYQDFKDFGKTIWTQINDLKQSNRREELPKSNTVIKFRRD
jgi:murein DD-endopeptidase